MTAPEHSDIIRLWPNGPPSRIEGVGPEVEYPGPPGVALGTTMVRNISDAALTVFKPTGKPNGVGIIVVPGGGWRINAWTHEGLDVARWLAGLGYTAFILKYRVMGTPPEPEKFNAMMAAVDGRLAAPLPAMKAPRAISDLVTDEGYLRARDAAAEDGRRAIAVVREKADAYGLRSDAIGMIGFSAGAFLTVDVAVDPRAEQLAFIAPIYGGETRGKPVPADAPPLFTVIAQDDRLLFKVVEGLYADWSNADRPAELHIFARAAMDSAWYARTCRSIAGASYSPIG